jgi:hypothetical protein
MAMSSGKLDIGHVQASVKKASCLIGYSRGGSIGVQLDFDMIRP